MPAKRRHSRRKKRNRGKPNKAVNGAEKTRHRNPVSTEAGQAVGCSVCRRSDQPVFTCPSRHRICELCIKGTGPVTNLRCPLCPSDSLSSRVAGFFINKVKNLWLSASNDRHTQSPAQPCTIHATQTLEFLCQKCDVLVCPYCKLAEHEGHETKSLNLVIADAKQRIACASSTRLSDFKNRLHVALKENTKRIKDFCQTRKEAEQTIHRRHAQLTGMIDKHRDKALRELKTMSGDVESCLEEDKNRLNGELNSLAKLQRRIDHSLAGADASFVLSVDREVQADWNCEDIMVRRSAALPSFSYKVQHKSGGALKSYTESAKRTGQVAGMTSMDKLEKFVECFIGHPIINKTALPKMSQDVKVTPVFRCCQDPEALVLSVCPAGAEKVAVSYSTSSDHSEGETKSFFEDGRPSKSFDFGLCTLNREGNGMFGPVAYNQRRLLGQCFRGMLSKSGRKWILMHVQDSGWWLSSYFRLPSPLSKICGRGFPSSFSISCVDAVAPLNFDITHDGDIVAVVDLRHYVGSPLDNNLKNNDRVVKIISFDGGCYFTDIYEPPTADFVPSDVCFYTLEGCTVLLVSDTGTDSIHVLSIQPFITGMRLFKKCQFQRYFIADCDMLKHPTALNTDEQGRLWVACKGGQLLTVELLQQQAEQ